MQKEKCSSLIGWNDVVSTGADGENLEEGHAGICQLDWDMIHAMVHAGNEEEHAKEYTWMADATVMVLPLYVPRLLYLKEMVGYPVDQQKNY